MDTLKLIGLWVVIFCVIYFVLNNFEYKVSDSQLYSAASAFCFTGFIMAIKFTIDPEFGWAPKRSWDKLPYGTYPILILGFMSLAFGCGFIGLSLKN